MNEGKGKDIFRWVVSLLMGIGVLWLGWNFPLVLTVFHVMLCFMLILVVLLQSGKAADLAGAFGGAGSQTAFGPRGAATFLSKATTWCAIMFMLASLVISLRQDTGLGGGGSLLERTQQSAPASKTPEPPATLPEPAPAKIPEPPPGKE